MSSEKSKSLFAAKFTASLVPSNNKDAVPNCFAAVSNCALPSKLTVCAEGLASVVVVAPSVPSKFKSNFVAVLSPISIPSLPYTTLGYVYAEKS